MKRRSFLAVCLALGVAPAVVKASSIMRVRPLLFEVSGCFPEVPTAGITEFTKRWVSANGSTVVMEHWYEDAQGFWLPNGRLDERGEYRGTNKLWSSP